MAKGKDQKKPQKPKGIQSSLEWRKFRESRASDQYRAIRGIEKLGGPVNSSTPRNMSQCTNHLGKSGCVKLAHAIAPFVKAKPQEVREVTKVHSAVVQFCENHNISLDECEPGDPMPICYDLITGLSPEAAVLFWVLSGAPNSDGTPLFPKFKSSVQDAKKPKQDEEHEGQEEESSGGQGGPEEEEEFSEDEEEEAEPEESTKPSAKSKSAPDVDSFRSTRIETTERGQVQDPRKRNASRRRSPEKRRKIPGGSPKLRSAGREKNASEHRQRSL